MKLIKKFVHNWAWILLLAYSILGVIYPVIGIIALACMVAPVMIAVFKGRLWCGNFCPRGSFLDIILSKFSLRKPTAKFIKAKWFRNLFLVVLLSTFALQLIFAEGNIVAMGWIFVRMIWITTVLAIILGLVYNQRSWCNICPMGTLSHYVGKIKSMKANEKYVTFSENKCVDCNLCTKACPMNIKVLDFKFYGKVVDTNCIKCNHCVDKCPKKSLHIT